jgi:putative intracellular protease/amidase
MKILMVITSHDKLGDTGKKTGFWLEEFAAPYYVFKEAGVELVLSSPKGGQPPFDPKSDEREFQTELTTRYKQDKDAQKELANTVKLSTVKHDGFDAVFYPGGHGPMWDLAEDKDSIALLEAFYAARKYLALVCHAPGVLRHVKRQDGEWLVKDKKVTGFANSEEEAVQLTKIVPFLVEDELKAKGGKYSQAPDWKPYVLIDGLLTTGQNPASSGPAATVLLALLRSRDA